MKPRFFSYFSLVFLLAAVFLNGCAPMTEAQREEMQYKRAEWKAQFVADRSTCNARGGTLIVDHGAFLDRDGIPRSRAVYTCTKRL